MVKLPKIEDCRGNLSFIESGKRGACPFEIERVYWIYDVPAGRVRHGRALRHTAEMIVAMSGSFDVVMENAVEQRSVSLNRSDKGMIVAPGTWREINNFSTNAVAMVLASGKYDENEYVFDINGIRDLQEQEIPLGPEFYERESLADSHLKSNVYEASVIELPRHRHANGSLTVAENGDTLIPFNIRRVFYLYDVPADAERGGHSHYQAEELIVALSGSFDVVLDDGKHEPMRFTLNRPYKALYVPTGIWRTLDNFSGGAVSMVLTSERFAEEDYVRDYEQFRKLTAI